LQGVGSTRLFGLKRGLDILFLGARVGAEDEPRVRRGDARKGAFMIWASCTLWVRMLRALYLLQPACHAALLSLVEAHWLATCFAGTPATPPKGSSSSYSSSKVDHLGFLSQVGSSSATSEGCSSSSDARARKMRHCLKTLLWI